MRRLLIILSGLAVLVGLVRLLRSPIPQIQEERPERIERPAPKPKPVPKPEPEQPDDKRRPERPRRRIVAPVLVALMGAATGLVAWGQFSQTTPPVPGESFDADMDVTLPGMVTEARVHSVTRLAENARDLKVSIYFKARTNRKCLPYTLALHGDARLKAGSVRPASSIPADQAGGNPAAYLPTLGGNACLQQTDIGPYFMATVSGEMVRSVASVADYRTTVATPAIRILRNIATGTPRVRSPQPVVSKWHTKSEVVSEMTQVRVDAAQPGLQQGGLTWETNGDGDDTAEMASATATLTHLPGEESANRALFTAGVLTGVAGGLLAWAFALLRLRRNRRG